MNPGIPAYSREKLKRDEDFWWRPGRVYVPAWQFSGLIYSATVAINIRSVKTTATANDFIQGINSTGVTGLTFTVNADAVEHAMLLPYDIDLSYPIYFRVHCSGASGTSGSILWRVKYNAYVLNSTAMATPATALDFAIPSLTVPNPTTTWATSAEGRIYGGKIATNAEVLHLSVDSQTLTTITSIAMLGLEMRYTPQRLYYGSMIQEAKAPAFVASDNYLNT